MLESAFSILIKYEVHENTHFRLNAQIFTNFSFTHESMKEVLKVFAILYFTLKKSTPPSFL